MDTTDKCAWSEVTKNVWYTSCKHEYRLRPHDYKYKLKLCPYCGTPITPNIDLERK